MNKVYYIYILASKKNGTLYIGITSNLKQRIFQHKNKLVKGFTRNYSVDKLVYFEEYKNIKDAIAREKAMKKWNRNWKLKLIESINLEWRDLSDGF